MKQLVQHLRSGVLELMDVPSPKVARGQVLIQTRASLISSGTERFLVEFGKASLLSKARQNPDRVRQVWEKVKTDGLWPTLEAVFAKLDEPLALGYCNSGIVLEVGAGVTDFAAGDRVVSNGPHAEIVSVPTNLCAKIPDNVSDEEASFAILSAIGLQGIRLVGHGVGENVAVFGLGLIGLITTQILLNSGARVLGIDMDPERLAAARAMGAETVNLSAGADPVAAGLAMSGGQGVDAVIITASAKNDKIVSQAANMSRKRGKIILVGVVNLDIDRAEFYKKELSFQVSCSYGPGRYDHDYEERGIDYPYPYVRWTEQRNIAAVLDLMSRGKLNVRDLITSRIAHTDAERAYGLLTSDRNQLGIVLQYPVAANPRLEVLETKSANKNALASGDAKNSSERTSGVGAVTIGMIGAGGFSTRVLLPAIKRTNVRLGSIASARGLTAAHAARKFGFAASTSDYRTILADPKINAVFITTRHHQHAPMIVEALEAGKHVFVEKPLAIDAEGLKAVSDAARAHPRLQLAVGFNRRFSPHAKKLRSLLAGRSEPATMQMLINAGSLPQDHWTVDKNTGGGRMIGEGCHWFDLASYLVDAPITQVSANCAGSGDGSDNHQTVTLTMADGSVATLHYLVNGHKSFPKERITVFCQGQVAEIDNFRAMQGYGWGSFNKMNLWKQDKGHNQEIAEFLIRCASGGSQLIEFDRLWNTTMATFATLESSRTCTAVKVDISSS